MNISAIGIRGAGTMGTGIAQVSAEAGYNGSYSDKLRLTRAL